MTQAKNKVNCQYIKVRKSTLPSALVAKAAKNTKNTKNTNWAAEHIRRSEKWTWCVAMDCKCYHPCPCEQLCGPAPSQTRKLGDEE